MRVCRPIMKFNATLNLNNAKTAEPNVNSYGIFEIRIRRSFIFAPNIQGVLFKKSKSFNEISCDDPLGRTDKITMTIDTGDAKALKR